MADDNDSLLREVEQELRREQLEKFWKRYNGLIIAGIVAVVLGVGGYSYYHNAQVAAAQKAGEDFTKAVALEGDDTKKGERLAAFEAVAKSDAPGFSALAKLHVAGAHVEAGETKKALATYKALAGDASADPLLRDYATLQTAALELGTADFTEIKNRLTPLATAGAAFDDAANEMLGVAAFKAGKLDEARGYLEPLLIDPKATQSVQERVKIVLGEIAAMELAKAGGAASKTSQSPETKPEAGKSTTESPSPPGSEADKEKPAVAPAAPDAK